MVNQIQVIRHSSSHFCWSDWKFARKEEELCLEASTALQKCYIHHCSVQWISGSGHKNIYFLASFWLAIWHFLVLWLVKVLVIFWRQLKGNETEIFALTWDWRRMKNEEQKQNISVSCSLSITWIHRWKLEILRVRNGRAQALPRPSWDTEESPQSAKKLNNFYRLWLLLAYNFTVRFCFGTFVYTSQVLVKQISFQSGIMHKHAKKTLSPHSCSSQKKTEKMEILICLQI